MRISKTFIPAIVASATIACISQMSSAATMVIDDFNSYSHNQALGENASTSTPYIRLGAAIAANFVATTDSAQVIDGAASGRLPLNWGGGNNGNVRRNYTVANAQDFSDFDAITIDIKSANAATSTTAKLTISNGSTFFQTATGVPISSTASNYTFNLNTTDMIRVDGAGTLESVLSAISVIGFRFENTSGSGSESIIIDNFTAVPEPAALGMLGLVGASLLGRRRRA